MTSWLKGSHDGRGRHERQDHRNRNRGHGLRGDHFVGGFMSEKFTPGPWFIEIGEEEYDGDIYVCHQGTECTETTIVNFEEPTIEDAANAHLIAAAPEMYEALDTLVAIVGLAAFKYEYQRAVLQEAMNGAMSALKKARGES